LTVVVSSTHAPLQNASPDGQTHLPAVHVEVLVQATPQPPQFELSVCSLTHAFAQSVSPEPQLSWHCPVVHTWLVVQTVPQAPQSLGSDWRSTH